MTENTPLSVFITGATGALGRAVTRQLKAAGHRITGATSGYENAVLVRADGGIPAYPDLLRAGELRSAMLAAKADVVLNLAPQLANHLPQARAAWDVRLVNEGVAALFEAAQAAGVKFVVHTSYAFADAESEALSALLDAVKAGEEKALHGSVPACVLRYGFVYGADAPELVIMRDALLTGKPVDGGSDTPAYWINAQDGARAAALAAQVRPVGQILDIVEDKTVSPAEFLGQFASSQGVNPPGRVPRFAPWAQPSKEQVALMSLHARASSAKAKEVLGWQPRFPDYKQGIDDALLSWRAAAEV
jgi:nucleoside-diphosphate-sugar epimerase